MRTFNDFSGLPIDRPKLTARQAQILELIQKAIIQTGAPPTRAEIAAELGFRSANAAEEHLKALAKKGVIELISGTSRGIRLRTDTLQALTLRGRTLLHRPFTNSHSCRCRLWAGLLQAAPFLRRNISSLHIISKARCLNKSLTTCSRCAA